MFCFAKGFYDHFLVSSSELSEVARQVAPPLLSEKEHDSAAS